MKVDEGRVTVFELMNRGEAINSIAIEVCALLSQIAHRQSFYITRYCPSMEMWSVSGVPLKISC